MTVSTAGLVLHTTPYGEASVVAKVFTRQLGMRSYLVKGVRGPRGRVKQNLLQPLSAVDMVVYENPKHDLNYIKELTPLHPETFTQSGNQAIGHSLRFFMTEVLYKALRGEEPMPELFDYVEEVTTSLDDPSRRVASLPIIFLLKVARHLGVEPLDNRSVSEPYFDLQEGRFVGAPAETTLPPDLSLLLHQYLQPEPQHMASLQQRTALIDALIAYFQLHFSGFHNFHSHEILHTILK